jgi:WD40 repeat protein
LWDIEVGCKLKTLPFGTAGISAVAFSHPEANLFIVGTKESRIYTIDTKTWATKLIGSAGGGAITTIAFSPDDKHFMSASSDGTSVVWELDSGKQTKLEGTKGNIVVGMAYSGDGQKLVMVSIDRLPGDQYTAEAHVRLWDATGGTVLKSFPLHQEGLISFAINKSGTRLATASLDNKVKIWNLDTNEELFAFTSHDNAAVVVALSQDDKSVLTAKSDGSINVHFLDLEESVRRARLHVTRKFKKEECNDIVHDTGCVDFPWAAVPNSNDVSH